MPELTAKLAAKVLAALVAVAILVGGILYFVTGPRRAREAAAQATATAATAVASKQAAQDALKITVDNQAAHSRIDIVTHENADAIRNAPGASAAVDTAVRDAGLRALCVRDAYRLQPACKRLLDPDPEHASD